MERSFFVGGFSDLMSLEVPYLGAYLAKLSSILKGVCSIGRLAAPLIGLRQLALLIKEKRMLYI